MHSRLKVNFNQTLAKHHKNVFAPRSTQMKQTESSWEDVSLTTGCGCDGGTLVCVGGALTDAGPPADPLEIRGWTED